MSADQQPQGPRPEVRERRPFVDHLARMIDHYGDVNGNALAAAVTYFAFLSFFPLLALAFAIFAQVAKVYAQAEETLVDAANTVLPGLVGGPNGVSLDSLQSAAPGIFSVGILLTLYSGLGWLSGMRSALVDVFEEPARNQPSFAMGKLRDITALLAARLGPRGQRGRLRRRHQGARARPRPARLGQVGGWFLAALAIVLGLAANTVLFFAFFHLLADPEMPSRSLWSGALLGAVASRCSSRCPPSCSRSPPSPTRPGLRHRPDPRGVDQLLLTRDRPCRRLGAHVACGPRPPRGRAPRATLSARRSTRRGRPARASGPLLVTAGGPLGAVAAGVAATSCGPRRRRQEEEVSMQMTRKHGGFAPRGRRLELRHLGDVHQNLRPAYAAGRTGPRATDRPFGADRRQPGPRRRARPAPLQLR